MVSTPITEPYVNLEAFEQFNIPCENEMLVDFADGRTLQ
jgi:hypothetical protein